MADGRFVNLVLGAAPRPRLVVFCDASFDKGWVWSGLTCPALGLRAGFRHGRVETSTEAELLAVAGLVGRPGRRDRRPTGGPG